MSDQKTLFSSSKNSSGQQRLVKTLPNLSAPPNISRQRFSTRMPSQRPRIEIQQGKFEYRISDNPLFKLRRSANTPSPSQEKPLRAIHTKTEAGEQTQPVPGIVQPLPVTRTSIVTNPQVRRRASLEPRSPCIDTTTITTCLTITGKPLKAGLRIPLQKCLKKKSKAGRTAIPLRIPGRYAMPLQPMTSGCHGLQNERKPF